MISDLELEKLRRFSPSAARVLGARPRLARFLRRAPTPYALRRAQHLPTEVVMRLIRLMRRRVFVHTAFAEANGRCPLETGALWAAFADEAVRLADAAAWREQIERSGAPLDENERVIARAVFALGKLGSEELNPSSDIDLLLVYGTDAGAASSQTPHEVFTRWAHRFTEILSRVTPDGFGFRVDLDLRPEGTTGAVVNSVDALESYYERFGLTWERAALLRLRAVVDSGQIAVELWQRIRPFVFPRVHDLRAVDELASMKQRVTAAATQDGFDVKRGHGGIREVEFVVQAFQLLHGGRSPNLRFGSTMALLSRLEEAGHLPHRMAQDLADSYRFLRRVEHALQYWEDRQTQVLAASGGARARVGQALLTAVPSSFEHAAFDVVVEAHRTRVHRVFRSMLGEQRDQVSADARLVLTRKASDEERQQALLRLGFNPPDEAFRFIRSLETKKSSPFSPGFRRSRSELTELGEQLVDAAAESPDPNTALSRTIDLFSGYTPVSLYERLHRDAQLRALLMRVLAVSAPLTRILSRQTDLEPVLVSSAFAGRVSRWKIRHYLREGLDLDDEEARLVRMRTVQARTMLGVGLAFLGNRIDVIEAGHRLSCLADALIEEALSLARSKVEKRFGAPARAQFGVCGLGRLGGRELGFFADIDIAFIYQGEGDTSGAKSISASEWAARIAQQVIWALSAPLPQGRCYEVDTRLRPSGNQGPLVTPLDAFLAYHETRSELWERQALLRARTICAEPGLAAGIRQVMARVRAHAVSDQLGLRLLDMRTRIVRERAAGQGEDFDVKLGAGGINDIEFAVQGMQLRNAASIPSCVVPSTRRAIRRLEREGLLPKEQAVFLRTAYDRMSTFREALTLFDERRSSRVSRHDRRLGLLVRVHPITREIASRARTGEDVFDGLVAEAGRVRDETHRMLRML